MARSTKKQSKIVFHPRNYLVLVIIGFAVAVGSYLYFKSRPLCANSRTCTSDLKVNIDNETTGLFLGQRITPPKIDLASEILKPKSPVLGDSISKGEKHIYINLATQTLYAYQGETPIMTTPISSGKWGRTPAGSFHVQTKLRATRMAGGQGSDAYDLPNVPYVMYFYGDFGLHGAYWHNNFGHPMSHGCVNMRIVDAKALYDWADGPTASQSGTPVSVCDSFIAPNNCIQEKPVN